MQHVASYVRENGVTNAVVAIPRAYTVIPVADTFEVVKADSMVISSNGTYTIEARRLPSERVAAILQLQIRIRSMAEGVDSMTFPEHTMGPLFEAPLSEGLQSTMIANAKAGKTYGVCLQIPMA